MGREAGDSCGRARFAFRLLPGRRGSRDLPGEPQHIGAAGELEGEERVRHSTQASPSPNPTAEHQIT